MAHELSFSNGSGGENATCGSLKQTPGDARSITYGK